LGPELAFRIDSRRDGQVLRIDVSLADHSIVMRVELLAVCRADSFIMCTISARGNVPIAISHDQTVTAS
jgi:hypothetical protein